MRCRAARRWFLESTLGSGAHRLVPSALEEHLRSCPACAAQARDGRRLVAELARLRVEIPYPLDVTGSVMARLRQFDAIAAPEVSRAWIGSLAGAALATAAATAWILIEHAASLEWAAGRLWAATSGMATALVELAGPLRHVAGAAGVVGTHAWASLTPLLSGVARLAPSYSSAALAAALLMISTTVLVVRRDLRRLVPTPPEKES